jgi:predicted DCC family thiol-disulfide oxidoreductase YuxK
VDPTRHPADALGLLVLVDGNCLLCSSAARFLRRHDRHGTLRFAALESPVGLRVRRELGLDETRMEPSLLVVQGARVHRESDAILELLPHLRAPWNLLAWFRRVPKSWRDAPYRWVARHRLRWFGPSDSCPLE